MEEFKNRPFFSFDRNYSIKTFFKEPNKYEELEKISKDNDKLISSGSNLSYSPLSFGENTLSINFKRFNKILDFDLEKKEITVESGITLAEFLNYTLKHNLWVPQLPGYPSLTLGGIVATNSHGKSCANHGTIRNSIKNILLFHKSNGWLNLSKNENKEIFELTIGGLGLTGSIVNITLKLSNLNAQEFRTKKNYVKSLKHCVELIKSKSINENSYIYSWNRADGSEHLGEGIIFENSPEAKKEKIHLVPNTNFKYPFLPFFSLWNKISIKIANELFLNLNKLFSINKREAFTKVIFPFYGKESYFYFFGKRGFLESQLLIPDNKIDEFFDQFRFLFNKHNPNITLLSFKNMSGEQKFLRFEDTKICMTIDYTNIKKNRIFMDEIDKVCVNLSILPSIIKDSRLGRTTFESCYQEVDDFRNKLKSFDKLKIYQSETSKRLGL